MFHTLSFAPVAVLCGLVLLGTGSFAPVQAQSPYQRQLYYQMQQQRMWQMQQMQMYRLQQQWMHQQFQRQFQQQAFPAYVPSIIVPPPQCQRMQMQQQGWVWAGSETLAGYGALTFRLSPNGQAVMIDAKETSTGTWVRVGDTMTLTFGGGNIVYTGNIDGQTMSGSASDNRSNWSFTVTLQ